MKNPDKPDLNNFEPVSSLGDPNLIAAASALLAGAKAGDLRGAAIVVISDNGHIGTNAVHHLHDSAAMVAGLEQLKLLLLAKFFPALQQKSPIIRPR